MRDFEVLKTRRVNGELFAYAHDRVHGYGWYKLELTEVPEVVIEDGVYA